MKHELKVTYRHSGKRASAYPEASVSITDFFTRTENSCQQKTITPGLWPSKLCKKSKIIFYINSWFYLKLYSVRFPNIAVQAILEIANF